MSAVAKKAKPFAHSTLGFGVPATTDPHHFEVEIPRGNTRPVLISEHLGMQSDHQQAVIDRALLERPRWSAIRLEVQRAFNQRLKTNKLAVGYWKTGAVPVDRLLGKELCVLAWAVETLEMDKIGIALRNWLALRPEERWWLFGMTAMAAGGLNDAQKGWRVALRYALGDQPQSEMLKARPLRGSGKEPGKIHMPDLFD